MPASYLDTLNPQVLTEVVRQVVSGADTILNFMGFQPGGANERSYGHGREGDYHVFDDVRKIAKGRAPATAAGRSSKQPMQKVHFTYPRMHDSISLPGEFMHNLGQIGNPAVRDVAGRDMIMRQTNALNQKAANWRVALTVGCVLRDSLYVHKEGDDWMLSYTSSGNLFQISQGIPAGNKSQLNMTDRAGTSIFSGNIIDVPWSSSGANIPLHIAKINQARAVNGCGPITDIVCTSQLWQHLITNDYLVTQAGISQTPFETYQRKVGERANGEPLHEYQGSFVALPGITFHITDEGLEMWDAANDVYTFTRHIEDNNAVFMANPTAQPDRFTMYLGSEPIAEYDGGPETVRVGLDSWSVKRSNPTCTEVYVLDNCLPVNHDPYALQYGTVVF